MNKNLKLFFLMLSLVLCLTATTFGQETYGNISGTIKDQNGAVVPNVAVTIQGTTTGFSRVVNSNDEGVFSVAQVPPGNYTVSTAAGAGFGGAKYENVAVQIGNTTNLDIQVKPGVDAVVNVNDSTDAPVDVTASQIQTNVNAQKIELLPKGVDFTSVLKTVPGTRAETNAGGFSVDGASGSENVFVIDGQEVTNFRTGTLNGNNAIPTQFVQEVQVKSSGFDAEFGGATGGVINVVTKGGGNDFRGEFGLAFNAAQLRGANRPSLVRFTEQPGNSTTFRQYTEYIKAPKSGGTDFFPTANLSGPIIKDKLWFFSSYSPQTFNTVNNTSFYTSQREGVRTLLATQQFDFKRRYEYAFARLDASPTNNLRLTSTFLWNPIVDEGAVPYATTNFGAYSTNTNTNPFANRVPPCGQFTNPSVGVLCGTDLTNRQGGRQNSNNFTAQAVYTPLSWLVVSGRFSRGFLNEKLASYFNPDTPRVVCQVGSTTIAGACTSGLTDPANTQVLKDVSIRTNYEFDGTFSFSGLGRHEIKTGYQRFQILNDVNRGYQNTGRVDYYYGYAVDDLVSVDPSCVVPNTTTAAACTRDADGNVTNRDPRVVGAGQLIRFGTIGKGENTNQSLYVQDKWQPFRRLTLNLGIRAEKEDLPSFNNLAPPVNFGFGDKVAPRLGFALDLFGDGKTRIFASYGQFYDRLKFELPRGSFGGDFYRVDSFEIFSGGGAFRTYTPSRILGNYSDAPGGRCPQTGFIGSGISRCQQDFRIASNSPDADIFTGKVDPDIKPFRQTEFTVGVERQFGRDYVLRGRYTFKNVDSAIEDAGIETPEGSEAYIIGNPGEGLHLQLLQSLGYTKSTKPQRRYDGLEVSLEKRLSNNYYFNANYTYSRLYGNYSGLASSDEAGRTSPGVNRFFDLPFIGFTAAGIPDNGRLATDRPHVFNAYGAYIYDWFGKKDNSTEFSFFTTAQSGTPVTSQIVFITTTIFTKRGDLGRTETLTQTDFSVSHKYRFGRDNRFTMAFDFNVLNLFDEKNVTGIYTLKTAVTLTPTTFGYGNNVVGAINAYTAGQLLTPINTYLQGTATALNRTDARYGQPNAFQGPRSVRFGFRLLF